MRIIKKYKYFITIVIALIIIFVGIYLKYYLNKNKYRNIEPEELSSQVVEADNNIESENICYVDIKGAVKKPNVYETNCDSKISDIIDLAGGLTENADTSLTNLAKKITNEMVIIIYTKEEVKNSNIVDTVIKTIEKECVCPNIQNDGCINNNIDGTITNNPTGSNLININTASIELLQTLPGIGESKARAIIKYRETNGNFQTIEDIQNVDGIGTKLYEEIKAYITT